MATSTHTNFHCCFMDWINQQHQDLKELLAALSTDDGSQTTSEDQLKLLVEKGIKHFEEYGEKRAQMVQQDGPTFISPPWCTPFENAFLWIGGCRPSLAIRLAYSVCGSELDKQLDEFLRGERRGNLAEISGVQLDRINSLHCRTIKEEDRMSSRMASLQEDIADEPLAAIASSVERVGDWSQDIERAMTSHSASLAGIVADTDKLSLSTLKELMAILTPLQAVDLLIATKKLHISMHEWGKRRDNPRTNE